MPGGLKGAVSFLAPYVAQTAGNAIGSYVSGQVSANKSLELSKYAYSRDLEMWNRQNEYNLPVNQVKRMVDAGLNPALLYGSPPVNVGGQQPKFNAPSASYEFQAPQILGMLSQYQDIEIKKQSAESLRLKNKMLSDQMPFLIQKAISEAGIKASEDQMKVIENSIEQYMWYELPDDQQPGQVQKRFAELGKSQFDAFKAMNEGKLKELEVSLYETLKKVGAGSQVGKVITSVLQLLIKKK